jgi:hypothetical protein
MSKTDTSRRLFHAGMAGALLSGTAAASTSSRAPIAAPYAVKRGRYGLSADFVIARANRVTLVPFDTKLFSEGPHWTLQSNGMLRINTTGLYRVSMCIDWVAQDGKDIDLRLTGIRRKKVGSPPGVYLKDDRLASVDVPGSDAPRAARYAGDWTPGVVPAGGLLAREVTVAPAGAVAVGDGVVVSHTALTDADVGQTAADFLSLRGRVVAGNRVRVLLHNPLDTAVHVPAGELRVMAMNLVDSRGDSADAWNLMHTTLEELRAGEMIYGIARNKEIAGDYIQATETSFLHIERHG